jgi:hypothetical protein
LFRPGNIMSRVWLILALLTLLFAGSWSVSEAQAVNLQFEPRSVAADTGADFTVAVRIANVEDLGFYQFDITFDPAVVQVMEVALGDFLASTGRSASGVGPLIDNQAGTVTYGGFSFGAQPGPNGEGLLAEVTFTGAADGVSTLRLGNIRVMNTDNVGQPAVPVGEAVVTIGSPASIPGTATPTPAAGSTPPAGNTAMPTPPESPTAQPAVTPGATTTVLATAQPISTVTPGASPTAGAAPTLSATSLVEPTITVVTTAEPGSVSSPSTTSTPVASGEVIEPSQTAAAAAAASETPAVGVAETAPTTTSAALTATSSPTSPAPLPSLATTSETRRSQDSQSQVPRWLLGVGVGALTLAGLLAIVLVVYLVILRKNT